MPKRAARRFTESEFKIIKAIVTSLSYAEVARKTGFTIPYVSRKVRDLYGKVYFNAWFDFKALGLTQVFIEASYDERFFKALVSEGLPYFISASHLIKGKRDRILMYALLPEPYVGRVVDALPLRDKEAYVPAVYYRWRPDEAELTKLEKGQIVGDIEGIVKVYSRVEVEEVPGAVRALPDEIDIAIISKLMQNPYANLIDVARAMGVRQQVVSYHFLRHVRPLWLYNLVSLDFDPEETPLKVYRISMSEPEAARRLAKALVQTPYFQAAFIPRMDPSRITAFTVLPGELELRTYRVLRRIDEVEDFELHAIMECDLMARWALPSRDIVSEGAWLVEPLTRKLKEIETLASG